MKELIKFAFNPLYVSELNDYTVRYKIKSVLTIFILTLLLVLGATTINILLMLVGVAESFTETGNFSPNTSPRKLCFELFYNDEFFS